MARVDSPNLESLDRWSFDVRQVDKPWGYELIWAVTDVYVGKVDGKVRRVALTVDFSIPKKQRSRTNGVKSGTLSFSIQYSNVGKPVTIQAPSNAKPLSDLVAQLGGSQKSTGSATLPPPSQKQLDAYRKCLDKASTGDLNALQRCNSLLK